MGVLHCVFFCSTCILYGLFACIIDSPGFVPAVFCRELDVLIAGRTSWWAYLPQFCEVNLESLGVLVKPEGDHGVKNVLAAYGFALLNKAFLCGFACDEAYEL